MAEDSPRPRAFQQFVEDWLAQSAAPLVALARHAALAHTFDHGLLALLLPGESERVPLMAELERSGLLQEAEEDHWFVHPTLRTLLLERWQSQDVDAYRAASARAAAYFQEKRREADDDAERVYHLLAGDPSQGLRLLMLLFEDAWAGGRLGFAERLVRYAEEQRAVLAEEERAWVRYLRARLAGAQAEYQASETILRSLCQEGIAPDLRGQALLDLGELLMATQRWREALFVYRGAQVYFVQRGDPFNAARAYEALGLAYAHLAALLGGLLEGMAHFRSPWRAVRHTVQHAPFLLYRWFSRRIPGVRSLYYGTNYQDWLIVRTLYAAIADFEAALAQLRLLPADAPFPVARVRADVTIRLADLRHRVDQWRQAEGQFQQLAADPVVAEDAILRATLDLVLGRAALTRRHLQPARQRLRSALAGFQHSHEPIGEMTTARLLGDLEMAARQPVEAVAHYLLCGQVAINREDLLTATDVGVLLAVVESRHKLPAESQAAIAAFRQGMTRRAYVARFPGPLAETFRQKAATVAAPFSYLLITLLVFFLPLAFGVVEMIVRAASTYPGPASDLLAGLLIFTGIPLVGWWLYELIYVAAGMRFVYQTPVAEISRFQPKYLVTLPEGLLIRDEEGRSTQHSWETLTQILAVDRALWRTPIALFSRWLVKSSKGADFAIEGVFRHYRSLQQEMRARLEQVDGQTEQIDLTFSFLRSRWMLLPLLLTLLLIPVSIFSWLDPTYPRPHWRYVSVQGGSHLHVIDAQGTLQIVDGWNSQEMRVLGEAEVGADATSAQRRGAIVYVTAGAQGLWLLDLSLAGQPRRLAQVDTLGLAQDVALVGRYAYVADGAAGLRVVDVAEPAFAEEVGHLTLADAQHVVGGEGIVLVAGKDGLLSVVDVTAPLAARVVGHWQAPAPIAEMALAGQTLFVADGEAGLIALDLSAMTDPQEIGRYDTPGSAQGLALSTIFVFVADGDGGLLVLDLTNPTAPRLVSHLPTAAPAHSVVRIEATGYLYAGLGSGGLLAIDALNPEDPLQPKGHLTTISAARVSLLPSYRVPITTILYEFLFWARLFFPLFGLVRLLGNRALVRRHTGQLFAWRAEAGLWLALIFLAVLTAWHVKNLTV